MGKKVRIWRPVPGIWIKGMKKEQNACTLTNEMLDEATDEIWDIGDLHLAVVYLEQGG